MAYNVDYSKVGIIKTITAKNVMLHSNIQIEFGPNVNYIVGQNGCGKSAVVTAIMLALGAKVSNTGKSLAINNVIKKGEQSAEVSITLTNEGNDAYEPEVYGQTITVRRKMKLDGSSCYNIISASGCVVSTKKEDLKDILRAINVQVENPICILTQELSKTFLNSRCTTNKYELFFLATQLHSLQEDYQNAVQKGNSATEILQHKKGLLSVLKTEMKQLEHHIEVCQHVEQQRNCLVELYKEFVWSSAAEKEQLAKNGAVLVEKAEQDISASFGKLLQYQKTLEEEKQKNEEIRGIQSEEVKIRENLKHLSDQGSESRRQFQEKQRFVSNLNKQITNLENDFKVLSCSVDDVKRQAQQDIAARRTARDGKMRLLREKREFETSRLCKLEKKLKEEREFVENVKALQSAEVQECELLEKKIQATEGEIEEIRQYQRDRLLAYGREIPQLVKLVREASDRGRFRREPLGPVGLHVKVKDPEWELAVECCLGSRLLRSFICDNEDDKEELYSIMEKLYPGSTPQVITTNFTSSYYDIASGCVKSDKYNSIVDVLNIDSPVIFNCLVDQRGVETILLIPDNEEARKVMLYNPPSRCTEAFSKLGTCFYPIPSFRQYASRKKGVTLIFRPGSLVEKLEFKTNQRTMLEESLENHRSNAKLLLHRISKLGNSVAEAEAAKVRETIVCIDMKMEDDIFETYEVDNSPLEDQLDAKQRNLKNLRSQRSAEKRSLESLAKELKNNEAERVALQAELEKTLATLSDLFLSGGFRCNAILLKDQNNMVKMHQMAVDKLEALKKKHGRLALEAEKAVAQAETICPRIDTHRKPSDLNVLIAEIKEMISTAEGHEENIVELYECYATKKEEYKKLHNEIRGLTLVLERYRSSVDRRLVAFNDIRTSVGLRVKSQFTTNLYTCGYLGKLKMDHTNKTMDIFFQPKSTSGTQTVRCSALSGGEKSFATVALLLALWDAVEMPFRVLDEFDVFMDQMNRKRSMDMMLSSVAQFPNRQFIFVSPLELVIPPDTQNVRILHLPSPHRMNREESMNHD